MSRTKGSGWGGGTILYQTCPACLKVKCFYDPIPRTSIAFRCTSCKKSFTSDYTLLRIKYRHELERLTKKNEK
jgi:hypothetical protein